MKSKERIKKNAEVFTPSSLAGKLISPIPSESLIKDCLDPACGNGNLLLQIFWRKIELDQSPLDALKSLYGVDIMPDNVQECRIRLLKAASLYEEIKKEHIEAVATNIVCADALSYDFSFNSITLDENEILNWQYVFFGRASIEKSLAKTTSQKTIAKPANENIFGY